MNNSNKKAVGVAVFILDRLRDRFEAMSPIISPASCLAVWRRK